jgi:hypothetical protein
MYVPLFSTQKVKLVDAGFIWTEPHSKRLKVKITIQAEVFNGAILQQAFVVEYVVENHMCMECNRANANPNTWTACAQVGRRVLTLMLLIAGWIVKNAVFWWGMAGWESSCKMADSLL